MNFKEIEELGFTVNEVTLGVSEIQAVNIQSLEQVTEGNEYVYESQMQETVHDFVDVLFEVYLNGHLVEKFDYPIEVKYFFTSGEYKEYLK